MAKSKRKQGEGMLRLRKDGRWEGRIVVGYNESGLPITKNVTAQSKGKCEEKLKVLKEIHGKTVEHLKPDMSFGEWIDFWYQNFCKPALRETTKVGYENCIYHHIIPSVGQIPLNQLTQSDLQQFYARLKKSGRVHNSATHGTATSNRMVRACHALCRACLEKAIAENLIAKNPSADCKLPPKKDREMQILSQSEMWRFLARAKEEGYYELFLLELSTGMRRGEILGLKWNDLNLANGTLRIARQVVEAGGKIVVQQPKTKRSMRTIILPAYMVEILADMKKNKICEWVFPSPIKENMPRNPSAVYHRCKIILERSGCKKVRFHDLRHTFATMAIENGMDIKTLSGMIGHSSAETTLNIYSHITDTMREQAAEKIDREIGGVNAMMPASGNEPSQNEMGGFDGFVEPYKPKIRKSGTGCVTKINDHLFEGRYSPKVNGKRMARNVYATTRAECEEKLAELIQTMKAEIAELKKATKKG